MTMTIEMNNFKLKKFLIIDEIFFICVYFREEFIDILLTKDGVMFGMKQNINLLNFCK
jgi:hypothetical protein